VTTLAPLDRTPTRPTVLRRTALAVTGVLACLLPTVWTAGVVAELVTGAERDHLFHQFTGQGLLLGALWLGGLLPLLVAGWRGVRPSAVAGALHLSVVVGAVGAAALAPGNGGLAVAAIVLVTGTLVWTALPLRPRVAPSGLDPLLAALALAAVALFVPFVLSEAGLQNGMHDEHAEFSHNFDMAWIGIALVLAAVAAATVPAARRLALWAMLGIALVGGARFAFTPETTWSLLAAGLGLLGAAATGARLARQGGMTVPVPRPAYPPGP
jgi:hypothetical protein